jgi:hypothetical protein
LAIVLNGTVCTTGNWPANVTISTAPLIASILLLRDFFQHAPELARGILKAGASEVPVFVGASPSYFAGSPNISPARERTLK